MRLPQNRASERKPGRSARGPLVQRLAPGKVGWPHRRTLCRGAQAPPCCAWQRVRVEKEKGLFGSAELNDSAVSTTIQGGVPTGIRTPVTAVKGRCPRPLDDGDAAWMLAGLGGASRDRTGDLLHAMQALSQLSYSPTREPRTLGIQALQVKPIGPAFKLRKCKGGPCRSRRVPFSLLGQRHHPRSRKRDRERVRLLA